MADLRTRLVFVLMTGVSAGLLDRAGASSQMQGSALSPAAAATDEPDKGNDRSRMDRYGDPLPAGAIARLGTVRFRHPFMVNQLAYTPDGKMLASACSDGTVRLWDAATGKPIRRFRNPSNPKPNRGLAEIRSVAISPDGKTVLGMENRETVQIWDLASGKQLKQLIGGNGFAMAFSPDGAIIAKGLGGSDKKQVSIWDVASGQRIRSFGANLRHVAALSFSPNGKSLAAGEGPYREKEEASGSSVRLWDPSNGKQVHELKGHSGGITAVVFSADGKLVVSASYDGTIRFWNARSGRLLRMVRAPEDPYPTPGGFPASLKGRLYGGIHSLALSPDGQILASGGWDGTVRVWDTGTGKELRTMRAHGREVTGLTFAPSGTVLASASWHHTIRLWDPATGKEIQPRQASVSPMATIAVSPDGQVAATACADRSILLWSLKTREIAHYLRGHGDSIYSLAFSPNSQVLASASADRSVRTWTTTGEQLRKFDHKYSAYTVTFAAGGRLLLSGGGDGVSVWDWSNGRKEAEIRTRGYISWLQASSDGQLVSAQGTEGFLWDAASRKEGRRLDGGVWLALAPDGRSFLTEGQDAVIRRWSVASGHELSSFPSRGYGSNMAGAPHFLISPDGRLVAQIGAGAVNVWELSTGKIRRRFLGHEGNIRAMAFSADGSKILSGGEDTTVLIWDLARRFETRPIRLPQAELQDLWRDLGGDDAERADQAVGALTAHADQSVPFFDKHLSPATAVDPKRLAMLIADLASDQFAIRENAAAELARWREQSEPALRQALAAKQSLETRRRIERVLAKLRVPLAASKLLRSIRAVEVLERIGTDPARKLLTRLAAGPPNARLTQEAAMALARMPRRN